MNARLLGIIFFVFAGFLVLPPAIFRPIFAGLLVAAGVALVYPDRKR